MNFRLPLHCEDHPRENKVFTLLPPTMYLERIPVCSGTEY